MGLERFEQERSSGDICARLVWCTTQIADDWVPSKSVACAGIICLHEGTCCPFRPKGPVLSRSNAAKRKDAILSNSPNEESNPVLPRPLHR
jgi:hypothetical protein